MKLQENLQQACLTLFSLVIIALVNVGQIWELRRASADYFNWKLQYVFRLEPSQVMRIEKINYDFYDAMSKVYREKDAAWGERDKKMDHIIRQRRQEIIQVLNEQPDRGLTGSED